MLPKLGTGEKVYAALMKIDANTLDGAEGMNEVLMEIQKENRRMKAIYLSPDTLFLLIFGDNTAQDSQILEYCREFQDRLESLWGIMSFVTISSSVEDYRLLPPPFALPQGTQEAQEDDGMITFLPGTARMDGFFVACLERLW